MARQGDVTDLDSARVYVARQRRDHVRATAICGADDALLGLVAVALDEKNLSGWVSYWLHADLRGRGLMARAAVAVCNRALAPEAEGGWSLERLELGHRVNNPASGSVARAAGFVPEGCERAKFLIDGERIDVLTYGRLRTDPAPVLSPLPWGPEAA